MTVADPEQLNRLRTWRTWLLVAVAAGLGAQYTVAPDRALTSPGYLLLRPIGDTGWRTVGILFLLHAVLLVPHPTRRWGHLAGAALYLVLFWATAWHGYFPAIALLAGGLNCGEFWLWQRTRGS